MKTPTYYKALIGVAMLAILTAFIAKAQITITESDMPQIGSLYLDADDTNPVVQPGPGGANVTWNLSALHNYFLDSIFALKASGTPYFSYFPSSNLLLRTDILGLGRSYAYDNLGSDSLNTEGSVISSGANALIFINTPAIMETIFPVTYNTHWKGSHISVEKLSTGGGDSEKLIKLFSYIDTADGWGMITTPAGTYNSLRINTISTMMYDSVYTYTTNTGWIKIGTLPISPPSESYNWFAKGMGFPVAGLTLDTAGKKVSDAGYLEKTVSGIDEVTDNSTAQMYPNPASSSINIVVKSANENGYIKIIDLTGREVESASFSNGKAQFNTSGYANGMYLYLITDMNGNLLDKGKFTVSH